MNPQLAIRTGLFAAAVLLAGCAEEKGNPRPAPQNRDLFVAAREVDLVPAGPVPLDRIRNPYVAAIAEGRRLYVWYNCYGCHGWLGGGGTGPALMDSVWIFGREPDNIFASIAKGRPKGMPVWGTRIPEGQIWELVAYLRSVTPETAVPYLAPGPPAPARPAPGTAPAAME